MSWVYDWQRLGLFLLNSQTSPFLKRLHKCHCYSHLKLAEQDRKWMQKCTFQITSLLDPCTTRYLKNVKRYIPRLGWAIWNWNSLEFNDFPHIIKIIWVPLKTFYIMRKVWYHQIWIQNYFGLIVSDLT